jgi:hypothetical protein
LVDDDKWILLVYSEYGWWPNPTHQVKKVDEFAQTGAQI